MTASAEWLAALRLNANKFVWPADGANTLSLSRAQFDALVLGLPGSAWARRASSA